MLKRSQDLALFLEKMRTFRNISQEEFTESIISNRQYQRYIRGDSPMPFHLLDAFAERLNIKKDLLLLEFDSHTLKETNIITDYFNAVNNNELTRAKEIKKNINSQFIIDHTNRIYFEYTDLLEKQLDQKIDKNTFVSKLKSLANYPKVLSQSGMSIIEVLISSTLLDYLTSNEQAVVINKFNSFFRNPNLVWSGNEIITYNVVLFRLSKYFGILSDYDNVIYYSNLGVKLNKESKYYINLEFYYYFLALSYFKKNHKEKFEYALFQCKSTLILLNNDSKNKMFDDWIKQDFDLDFNEFYMKYLSTHILKIKDSK